MFTYPASSLDRPDVLESLLGSFWAGTYPSDLVDALADALLAQQRQLQNNFNELIESISRRDIPLFHSQQWTAITLLESQAGLTADLLQYGDGATFAADTANQFGAPTGRQPFSWPLPPGLVALPLLCNRISAPSLNLVGGLDFLLENGSIIFRENPFDSPLILKETLFTDNVASDRQLTLWGTRASFDLQQIYQQFGYVLELNLPTSQPYKDLINVVFDSLGTGTTAQQLGQAWSALTGVPLAAGNEQVELIRYELLRTLVITNQRVYQFKPQAVVQVDVNQPLNAGDPITDALQFFEFNHGQVPTADQLPALTLGRGFLAPGFFGDLVFRNADVPLIVSTDPDGFTRISFEISGWPADVQLFFDEMHARGRASGQTLAHLLDQRPLTFRDTEPQAGALPATINPMAFLCQNLLRDNAYVVKIRPAAAGGGVGLGAASILRRCTPPQTVAILDVELDNTDPPIKMETAGTPTAPGYEESVSPFLGLAASDTIDGSAMIRESVQLRVIGGRCL